jgi:hypothetical protein
MSPGVGANSQLSYQARARGIVAEGETQEYLGELPRTQGLVLRFWRASSC